MTDRPCSLCRHSGRMELIRGDWLVCVGSEAARASGHGMAVVAPGDTCGDFKRRSGDAALEVVE